MRASSSVRIVAVLGLSSSPAYEPGPRAGSAGVTMPGQVVPENMPIFIRPDGSGSAMVNGHPVIVGPNSSSDRAGSPVS